MKWAVPSTALAIALVASSSRSFAAEPDAASRAASIFSEGRLLLSQGRFDLACDRFDASQRIAPSIGALLNIADCRERQGELRKARAACLEARALAMSAGDTERATFANTRASELDSKTPRLRIDAPGEQPSGTTVLRDGEPLGAGALGTAVPLDPGIHRVETKAGSRITFEREVALAAGAGIVVVTLPTPARMALAPPPPPDRPERKAGLSNPVLVAAGTGGAALIAGVATGILAASRWNDVTAACPERRCPDVATRDRVAESKEGASNLALTSTITLAAGTALIAGALLFHFLLAN